MPHYADPAARQHACGPPSRRKGAALVATALATGLALTACSSGDNTSAGNTSAPSSAAATACPQAAGPGGVPGGAAPPGMPGGAAPPSGMPSGGAPGGASGMPGGGPPGGIPMAKTIKPSDTSTSIVINPTGAPIQCGKTKITAHNDVVYATPTTNGQKSELKLDIQVPETSGKKPLVIYITGGGFVMAQKSANLDQRTYVAEQGYVVASIQYRTVTSSHATYSDGVADVKSAVRYLRAHAAEYGLDAGKVAVWGQSAGGYLAAMTGATNGDKQFDVGDNLDQSSDVQGVVDQFGPSNLSQLEADFDAAAQDPNYVPGNPFAQWVYGPGTNKSIKDYTPEVAAANPITHISSKTAPFVLMHGSEDHLVSPSQTLIVHNALRAKGIDSTRYVLSGADHGDLSFMGNMTAVKPWSTQETMNHIVDFLHQHLGG